MFHALIHAVFPRKEKYPYTDILMKAIKQGDLGIIKTIVNLMPVPKNQTYEDHALMLTAVKEQQSDIVKFFIEQDFRVNKSDCSSEEKLLYHAVKWGDIEIISLLLAMEASMFSSDSINRSPVHLAISNNRQDILALFLSKLDVPILNSHNLLHFAIDVDNHQALISLWIKGLSIVQKKKNSGQTPFCLAVKNERWDALNILFSFLDISNMDLRNHDSVAPFYVACMSGNQDILQKYLSTGFNINTPFESKCSSDDWEIMKNCCGFTGLHFAVERKNLQVIEFLLSQGADLKAKNAKGLPPLHLAIENIKPGVQDSLIISDLDQRIIQFFLEHGAMNCLDANGNTALHYAFLLKKYEVLQLLLLDEDNVLKNFANIIGLTHFHIACTRNDTSLVQRFLNEGVEVNDCVSVNLTVKRRKFSRNKDWNGFSALHFAAFFNRSKIVQLLLNNNADFLKMDSRGMTPFHIACQHSYEKYLFLVERFFELDNESLETELLSSRTEQFEIIDEISKKGYKLDGQDFNGQSPAYYIYNLKLDEILQQVQQRISAYSASSHRESASNFQEILEKELLERRKLLKEKLQLDFHAKDFYKEKSILHYLVEKNMVADKEKLELLKSFLDRGADPNALNKKQRSLLQEATRAGNTECMDILLKYKANIDYMEPTKFTTALHIACNDVIKNLDAVIDLLLESGANVHARDLAGETPLHYIAAKIKPDTKPVILNMLKSGVDINCQDFVEKMTPLHVAVKSKNTAAIQVLLRWGADINIEDFNGKTVICYINDDIMSNCASLDDLSDTSLRTVEMLLYHAVKLQVINLSLSRILKDSLRTLKERHAHASNGDQNFGLELLMHGRNYETVADNVESFIQECGLEKERLAEILISKNVSLLSFLFKKNKKKITELSARNAVFLEILEERVRCISKLSFKNYGYLLELKYNEAMMRRTLKTIAGDTLRHIASPVLPDLCNDYIFQYFSNKELKEFIDTAASSSSYGQTLYYRYCLKIRQVNESIDTELSNLRELVAND